MSVGTSYEVMVPRRVRMDQNMPGHMLTLADRPIFRPAPALLTRIKELTAAEETFGFETTLSGRGYIRLFEKMRMNEYRIGVFYLWLPNADMSVARVKARVRQGGHNVLESVVRRRYGTGPSNFFRYYRPIAHSVWLLDGSEFPPRKVAHGDEGGLQTFHPSLFESIKRIAKKKSYE